jgi:hypothetical protein
VLLIVFFYFFYAGILLGCPSVATLCGIFQDSFAATYPWLAASLNILTYPLHFVLKLLVLRLQLKLITLVVSIYFS